MPLSMIPRSRAGLSLGWFVLSACDFFFLRVVCFVGSRISHMRKKSEFEFRITSNIQYKTDDLYVVTTIMRYFKVSRNRFCSSAHCDSCPSRILVIISLLSSALKFVKKVKRNTLVWSAAHYSNDPTCYRFTSSPMLIIP